MCHAAPATSRATAAGTGRKRPRDRKAQIVSAAADLFYRLGYHNVGTEDIASAVGITAGALYRHFRNKQELLEAAISTGFERAVADIDKTASDDFVGVLATLAASAAERRDIGVLWSRESRHLAEDQRKRIREQLLVVPERLTAVLRAARPELTAESADFLAWVALAVLTSPSYHATPMAADRLRPILHRMVEFVCISTRLIQEQAPSAEFPVGAAGLRPASRKEAIVVAATQLFNEVGYHAVSMDDIGAAVGITSASVYHHFGMKSDLLVTALTRAASSLQLDMSRALATARTPQQAIDTALASYIELAFSNKDLIGALISEVLNLPDDQRHAIRRLQHDYIVEWVNLLTAQRPNLNEPEARFIVHGALTIVNDVSRTTHLRQRSKVAEQLHDLVSGLLYHA